MPASGIFFGSSYGTHIVAEKIQTALGPEGSALHNIGRAQPKDLLGHDYLVLGTSTWGDGATQPDWNEFPPRLRSLRRGASKRVPAPPTRRGRHSVTD